MLWVSGRPDGHRVREITAPDGERIPLREWHRPDPRAVILYLHGQGDHSGPFAAMGDCLYDMGFSLYAHDHRGFGLSRARRGHIDSYDQYLDDVATVINHAQSQYPGKPCFLLGLSMGGHLALRAAYRNGHQLAGVIALSPGLKLRRMPPLRAVVLAVLYALFDPDRYLPAIAEKVITTRNQTHLERAQQDERWVTTFTARFYVETIRSVARAWREAKRIQIPVLILQAGADELVCADTSRRFSQRIGHPDVEYRLLEGLAHNLVAEPEMPEIARTISDWIDRHLEAGKARSGVQAGLLEASPAASFAQRPAVGLPLATEAAPSERTLQG